MTAANLPMKKLLALLLLSVSTAFGATDTNLWFATITLTNLPVTSNGLIFTQPVAVSVLFSNNATSATVLTNTSIGGATTNLFLHFAGNASSRYARLAPKLLGSNVIQLSGLVDQPIAFTATGNWCSLVITSRPLAKMTPIRTPLASEGTNAAGIASSLLTDLNTLPTNSFSESAIAFINFLSRSNIQSGANKTFFTSTNRNGYGSNILSKRLRIPYSATETNGLAFESGGSIGSFLEPDAFGIPKLIQVSDGDAAEPTDPAHLLTVKWGDIRYPGLSYTNIWYGTNFFSARAWFIRPVDTTNSYAVGNTNIGGQVTNANIASPIFTGTNAFNGMITLKALDLPSLSFPGPTHNVSAPTTPVYEISGASANFSIDGFALPSGSVNQAFWIINPSAFNMTLVHNAGDPAASNRMISLTGADQVTSGAGSALLWYSLTQGRWIILQFSP